MAAAVVLIQFVLRSRNPPPKKEEKKNSVMPSHRFHAQEKNKPFRAPSL